MLADGLEGDGVRPPFFHGKSEDDDSEDGPGAGEGLADGRALGCNSGIGILLKCTITV